ncbi:hypothetical protein EB093_08315 [bacterium]|nr:hypothetical protein [bacterium]
MLKLFSCVVLLSLVLTHSLLALTELDMLLDVTESQEAKHDPARHDDEKSIENIQNFFLQKVFFEPMAETSKELDPEPDNDDNAMGGFGSEKEMNMSMMNRLLSKKLSERDFLGLKRRYLKRNVQAVPIVELSPTMVAPPYTIGRMID